MYVFFLQKETCQNQSAGVGQIRTYLAVEKAVLGILGLASQT